jgi:hypothetical protein
MKNSEKYHFADFTRQNYRRLVKLASLNYTFRTFQNYVPGERFILWRHDVDLSMQAARKLSIIEAEEGVKATYFFHLHNTFYNLFEKENTLCGRDILSNGHEIGLHFDPEFYDIAAEEELIPLLERESRILEDLFNRPIRVFSFHNPTPSTLGMRSMQYAGLINTYGEYFQKEVGYCSDSNGYWRHKRLEDVLQKHGNECLQVLTHPGWWQDDVLPPYQRVRRCVEGKAEKTLLVYRQLLASLDRENIDWDADEDQKE